MRINHKFARRFYDFELKAPSQREGVPGAIQFKDPVTGQWRSAGARGVHCGEVPNSGTYTLMECSDGHEYYEFIAFEAG